MSRQHSANRRTFLKMAAGGVAGLSVLRMDNAFAAQTAWTPKMAINPNIDNMKVVCCYDTTMLKPGAVMTNFTSQNNAVNATRVEANLDEMACRLATKPGSATPTPDQAWKTIFRSSKPWASTRVAIKVNCVNAYFMPRIAIVAKLCKVLNGFGVPGKNIVIYDGCSDASGNAKYTPYCSLTDATKVNAAVSVGNSLLGNRTSVTIDGWTKSAFTCTTDLVLGNVDILINLAANKGHDRPYSGYFTMCMKNHYGSFDPPVNLHDSTVPFISINKHDAIIGGNPVRQQLCIIDSLTGTIVHDPAKPPDVAPPYRLIMGTFAPAVDYLCAIKIREPIMKAVHDQTVVNSLLSYFGYTSADAQWEEYTPGSSNKNPAPQRTGQTTLSIVLANSNFRSASVIFTLDPAVSNPIEISLFDIQGNLVRDLRVPSHGNSHSTLAWDGTTNQGSDVSAGTYLIKATAGSWVGTEKMHLIR